MAVASERISRDSSGRPGAVAGSEDEDRARFDDDADLGALRRNVAFGDPGEERRIEPLYRDFDQGDVAEKAGIENPPGHALPRFAQAHAALAHANDGVGAVRYAVGGEAAEWSGGVAAFDARGKLIQLGEGARGEDVLR